jgi:hypothetical protein
MNQTMLDAVRAALAARDYVRAEKLAGEALAAGTVHPVLLTLRGNQFQAQGHLREALADFTRAVSMAPKDIVALNAMGFCLQSMDRFPESMQAFNAALSIRADFPPALFNRGYSQELMGEIEAARKDYEAALKLDPRFPEPAARLALFATSRRDWKEVRERAAQALAVDSRLTPALLALVTADMEEGKLNAARTRLTAILASAWLTNSDRAIATGLMGDLFDHEGRTEEAFKAHTDGNAAMRAVFASRYAAPGMQTALGFVEMLVAYFAKAPDWIAGPRETGSPAAGHVFVLGFPRSGTTLLEQALASHPDAVAASEKEFLIDAFREFMGSAAALDKLAAIDERAAAHFRETYWQRLRNAGIDVSGKMLIDKQPLNTVKLPLIAKLFPDAKVLFAMRDPRDVVLSCFRRRFRMNIDMFEFLTLDGAARYYDAVMRLGALYREKLPLNLMVSRHEEMIEDFDAAMRAICEFTGLSWNESMRGFAQRAANVATPSAPQLAGGLTGEGVGQWRRYAAQLAPVMPLVQPWVEKFGYAKE